MSQKPGSFLFLFRAVWIPVTDVLCALVETPAGNLGVVLVGGTPGWFYYFVVVF